MPRRVLKSGQLKSSKSRREKVDERNTEIEKHGGGGPLSKYLSGDIKETNVLIEMCVIKIKNNSYDL